MAVFPHFKGVEVEVISNGQPLPLYDDPEETEHDKSRTRQNYIEAVTGATFSMKVTLNRLFEMGHCDAARIIVSFDGEERGWYRDVKRGHKLKHRPLEERQVIFSGITQYCEDSGQWRHGKLSFGKLIISKCGRITLGIKSNIASSVAETMGSRASPLQVQKLGQIRLSVVRVRHEKSTKPSSRDFLNRIGEVSEKAMKGRAIANTIEYYILSAHLCSR